MTTTATQEPRVTDVDYELADRIERVLESAVAGLVPSAVARRAGISTAEARQILGWMVSNRYAHTSGNGAWTRYHAGRV